MRRLNELRQEIDAINDELVGLLIRRFEKVDEINHVKSQMKLEARAPDRIHQMLFRIQKDSRISAGHLKCIVEIMHIIFEESTKYLIEKSRPPK